MPKREFRYDEVWLALDQLVRAQGHFRSASEYLLEIRKIRDAREKEQERWNAQKDMGSDLLQEASRQNPTGKISGSAGDKDIQLQQYRVKGRSIR